jgi:hypothetical protein
MEYHQTVIALFEPWTIAPVGDIDANIIEISTVAKARFETLARLYFLRHSFDSNSNILPSFLLFLASGAYRSLSSQQRSEVTPEVSTFFLCSKGLHDGGKNNYISILFFHLIKDMVDPDDSKILDNLKTIESEFETVELRPELVHSIWPVFSSIDTSNKTMGEMIQTFSTLELQDRPNSRSE